jgi:hypothetical protein
MKQNLRKKALVPAIAMVVASVIALSGVTYAWFTTGNTASVTGLDVNVQTANGIQVSLDASAWRSVITANDIKNAVSNAVAYSNRLIQFPEVEIAPVSSAGNVVDGKLEMFYGEYNKDGTLMSKSEVEQNRTTAGNFVAFDLFFKSSMDQTLTLNLGDATSFVKGTDALGGLATVGTEKAVRVAFLPMGSAQTAAAARALKGNGEVLVWEPNADSRADGVEADGGKLAYKGFKAEFAGVAEDSLGENEVKTVDTFNETKDIVELKAGINKMRVYIWLEGQDVDCINNISFGDFTANLSFSVPEVEG